MYIKIFAPKDTISFMNERNQEVEGIVEEVYVYINAYQKNIHYTVLYQNNSINVDGETYRVI